MQSTGRAHAYRAAAQGEKHPVYTRAAQGPGTCPSAEFERGRGGGPIQHAKSARAVRPEPVRPSKRHARRTRCGRCRGCHAQYPH